MSEEAKSTDYVTMTDSAGGMNVSGLEDPNLSQEDKDLRLAIALQQQENAAVYNAHKKKHEDAKHAKSMRNIRSNAHSGLAAIRKKDHGKLRVPAEYTTPDAYKSYDGTYTAPAGSDAQLAAELGNMDATSARIQTVLSAEEEEKKSAAMRNIRHAHSGRAKQK